MHSANQMEVLLFLSQDLHITVSIHNVSLDSYLFSIQPMRRKASQDSSPTGSENVTVLTFLDKTPPFNSLKPDIHGNLTLVSISS